MMRSNTGASSSDSSVSLAYRPNRMTTYTAMTTAFWSSDARAALTAVFTWSVSLMTRAIVCPARVINDTDQVKTAVSAALASLLQNAVVIAVYVVILFGL